ncbi:MAG: biotin-dependent carboxyltransferase family protein [Firmicutes bacterium]|nr:biotin-dependent carboxyltransferase family protein [Bacillota bacterium]
MNMTILTPGPLSTVQDEGRFGAMDTGFSPGGAMDGESMALANLLVGNIPGTGVIEMTMAGLSARFDCDCVIALTGADMYPKRNGRELELYRAVEMRPGDELTMGAAKRGMRGYLAVAGGFDLPMVMGSQSTNLKCGLGGFRGRKLQRGDELPLNQSVTLAGLGSRCLVPRNDYPEEVTLRVILGPQDDFFTDRGIETFLGGVYIVSEQSDRMGIRLEGEKIENKNGVDIISDGIAAGSVQIPASGTPIIMMADRQTTGGYAKIATVISADLKKAAQARPGSRVRFEQVTGSEAVRLRREEIRQLRQTEYELLSYF